MKTISDFDKWKNFWMFNPKKAELNQAFEREIQEYAEHYHSEKLKELLPSKENIEAERLFLELFQGLEMRSDIEKFPNVVFYLRDGKRVLEIEKENLYIDYYTIWSKFECNFAMEHKEIQSFIKSMVEKHFKWSGLTPNLFYSLYCCW